MRKEVSLAQPFLVSRGTGYQEGSHWYLGSELVLLLVWNLGCWGWLLAETISPAYTVITAQTNCTGSPSAAVALGAHTSLPAAELENDFTEVKQKGAKGLKGDKAWKTPLPVFLLLAHVESFL